MRGALRRTVRAGELQLQLSASSLAEHQLRARCSASGTARRARAPKTHLFVHKLRQRSADHGQVRMHRGAHVHDDADQLLRAARPRQAALARAARCGAASRAQRNRSSVELRGDARARSAATARRRARARGRAPFRPVAPSRQRARRCGGRSAPRKGGAASRCAALPRAVRGCQPGLRREERVAC